MKIKISSVFLKGCAFLMLASVMFSCNKRSGDPKILVFSKTAGFHHASIPQGKEAIMKLGQENDFAVDTTSNAAYFTDDSLKNYSAVVFLSTTGNLLNKYQEAALERYIQAGGGYAGIHAASDAEYDWGWYGRLVGGYFLSHPKIQQATLNVVDKSHISTEHLPDKWTRTDEWYNFKKLNPDVHVLIKIDEKSYEGGKNGDNHPMAWYHDFDGGRAFYTELGHTEESFSDPQYLKHLLGGIEYAIGDNEKLDYSKATTQNVPEEDRFVKTTLVSGVFTEPTEMAILPNLDILVTERRGGLKMYDHETQEVKQVGFLNAYHKTLHTPGVNAEEGVLGIAADPNFEHNHYVYIFYSPADTSVNRLSRFEFRNDTIDNKTEKVILQFYSQREICCHTGGSVAFGPDRLLFVSAGDNSTPFDEPNQPYVSHGYAPLDDRPGHQQYDSRRSAGNTNDLRGKILRIRVKEDGTYEIPKGNLFPPNTPKTRPEIYVMGDRNPYRISVDQKNGNLYWGEVGPDANMDSLDTRGPRGYDEVNQARKAGYFGWPLFIGNNYPYHRYNYATGKSGPLFDPAKPVNDSRNNTGLTELPPAQPAFIWYPYAESPDFPQIGTGGRTAMAGPVYYTDLYPEETRYPDYYNGKFFFYEWIRNWIKVVTMQPNGDFDKMESFIDSANFTAPEDMEVGPDGRIYVLEYGQGWFTKNPDAGLARIDYLPGNRPPKVEDVIVDKTSGSLPFTFTADVKATDPENDRLTYIWMIGKDKKQTREPHLEYTLAHAGNYNISVEVMDRERASAKSNEVTVYAGNSQPEVAIDLQGNHTFYFAGQPIGYQVKVADEGANVDMDNLFVTTDYISGRDLAIASQGHQQVSETMMGKNIMLNADCKSCHKINEKSIGPSFTEVAKHYQKNPDATEHLVTKITQGGSGVWGETNMPGHPNMEQDDIQQIVQWVLSLANAENTMQSLPASGKIVPKEQKEQNSVLRLIATYTDNGGTGIMPLSATEALYLRSNSLDVRALREVEGLARKDSAGNQYLEFPAQQGWIKGEKVDLTGIASITLTGFGNGKAGKYQVEVREGAPDGQKIGEGDISFGADKQKVDASVALQKQGDGQLHDIYLVIKAVEGGKALLKNITFVPASSAS